MLERALIYVRGTDEEIEAQLTHAYQVCENRGYEVVGVLRDQPGGSDSWHTASRMLRHHEAGHLIFASSLVVPECLESATGSLPGPRRRPGGGVHRATRRRRVRPVERPGAGA
jgi:hypothetical protein